MTSPRADNGDNQGDIEKSDGPPPDVVSANADGRDPVATMSSCKLDPKELATKYLKEKRIMQLFEEMGAYVVLEKPDNPEEFLITKLKEVIEAKKQKEALTFFNEEDVSTMFSVFDTTGRGYVTPAQYEQVLKNFGITKPKLKVPTEQRIGRKLFEANMLSELINKSITK